MFALRFSFPAGRYHATPWGRNVNEADVAWPPEPWRLFRALVATWRRKGDREHWSEDDLARLIDELAETLPVYHLPRGAVHAHTRHYVPQGRLAKGTEKTALIFDAFVHLPRNSQIAAVWPELTLPPDLFDLAADLAASIGYLGRAESWTECRATEEWHGEANCRVAGTAEAAGTPVRMLAPRSRVEYSAERHRLLAVADAGPAAGNAAFRTRKDVTDTLPERLVDALTLDTSDYQDRGWSRPPASREILYLCSEDAVPGVIPSRRVLRNPKAVGERTPTVARFLVAGRPLPRIEDAVKIGELMRRAALAKFGWNKDEATGRWIPRAPWQISGRGPDARPLKGPSHGHAFWLPEDADSDGWIDHISVYISNGIDGDIRSKLDRITRLWLRNERRSNDDERERSTSGEWRLALEGFGQTSDFEGGARIFNASQTWRSTTPFLASGHLKAAGYPGEVLRLLKRRGQVTEGVAVDVLEHINVGGTQRRAIHFHRFRSRSGEKQPDAAGALLRIRFPKLVKGPIALGFGSHFGLGLFIPED